MAYFAKLCEISDVDDGEIAAFEVEGETVAVARVGDSYYAFDDTCTHAMCSLADGWIDGTAVTCPCHSSEFDIKTGEVLTAPATEAMKTYDVRVSGDDIQVKV